MFNSIFYHFYFLPEDREFQVDKTYLNGSPIYSCGLPLMHSEGMLIESPSAKPYKVPLDYGIKECDVSIVLGGVCSSVTIFGYPLMLPIYEGNTTSSSTTSPDYHHEYLILNASSSEQAYSVQKINQSESLNFRWFLNVVNGKSPNKLFEVDGSGNTLRLLTQVTPIAVNQLFILKLYNIKFGGTPSPDY